MDEYLLSDDPVPEELLKEAERIAQQVSTHKIYFNKDTEEIYAISNEHLEQYENFFEVNTSEISYILQNDNLANYKIKFTDDKPIVILKPVQDSVIPSLVRVKKVKDWDSELTIEQYPYLKKWGFQLRADKRKKLESAGINSKLEFFIVDPDNRNFIVNTVTFNFQRLCLNEKVFIPFSHYKEEDKNVEIYTKAVFSTIGLTTLYDTKD